MLVAPCRCSGRAAGAAADNLATDWRRQTALVVLAEHLQDLDGQIARETNCRLVKDDILRRVAFLKENLALKPTTAQEGILSSSVRSRLKTRRS